MGGLGSRDCGRPRAARRLAAAVAVLLIPAAPAGGALAAKPRPKPVAIRPLRIYVMRPDGSRLRAISDAAPRFQSDPAWSPDGTRIAFVAGDPDGPQLVYTTDASGRRLRRMLPNDLGVSAAWPTWSPRRGLACVLASRAAGTLPTLDLLAGPSGLTELASPAARPAWSPDGRWIAYGGQGGEIDVVSPQGPGAGSGGAAIPRPPFRLLTAPAWAPDSKRLAYVAFDDAGRAHVFVTAFPAPALPVDVTRSGGSDVAVAWSPDGKRLALLRVPPSGRPRIVTTAPDGTHVRVVELLPAGTDDGRISWSARNELVFALTPR